MTRRSVCVVGGGGEELCGQGRSCVTRKGISVVGGGGEELCDQGGACGETGGRVGGCVGATHRALFDYVLSTI